MSESAGRLARLPLVGRSDRLHTVYRRVADSTRFSRPALVAGLLLRGAGRRAPSAAPYC